MRIIELKAESFKRLSAIDIRPDGDIVQIGGMNEQGKTSVLDAIWAALGGGRAIPTEPIRKGQDTALIELDLGDIKVRRTFGRKEDGSPTTSLTVKAADGSRFDKPQDVLNAIWNAYAVDPYEFTRMKPAEQFDAVRQFVPGVDFMQIARDNQADYDARTVANRRAKELRAQADGIQLPAGKIPATVDLAALEKRLAEASDHNTMIERRAAKRQSAVDNIGRMIQRSTELRAEADEIDRVAAGMQKELDEAGALPEPIDASAVQARLVEARQGNEVAARAARRTELSAEAMLQENTSIALTRAIDTREADKQKAIAEAKMPVQGLSFGDGCVLLDGVPFEQGSAARRLRAGVEIAAAMNPRLRVIRISDGSLLDKNSMAWLAEYAAEHDLQVWLEVVGDGDVGFVIEDGHLKGDAPEEEEAV